MSEQHIASAPQTERLDVAYFQRIAELVDQLGRTQFEPVARAGELVASAWENGGRLLIARTHHCLHYEGIHRSSGPLGIGVLDDEGDFYDCRRLLNTQPEDVVVIHTNSGTYGRTVGIALRAREMAVATIALTQLPYEVDPAVPAGHPSGKRLSEVVDVTVDLGGDVGDGAVQLPNSGQRIAPSSGVTGLLAFWMIVAAACDSALRAGHTPLVLDSLLLPGAAERNDAAMAEWQRTGFPFASSPSGRG